MTSYFRIQPRPEGMGFILFNEASGGICGDRLFHGNGKTAAGQWPFTRKRWMEYEDEAEANRAAIKLQRYLNARTK